MQNKTRSLHSMMIIWAVSFILPILLVFGVSSIVMMQRIREQSDQSSSQILKPYINEIDVTLTLVRQYIVTKNVDIELFEKTSSNDSYTRFIAMSRVQAQFSADIEVYDMIDSIFFYKEGNIRFVSNDNRDYKEQLIASETIKHFLTEYKGDGNIFSERFLIIEKEGNYFLLTAVKLQDYYWGCWINIDGFLNSIRENETSSIKQCMFASPDGEIYHPDFSQYNANELKDLYEPDYIIVMDEAKNNDFRLIALIDASEILAPLLSIRYLIIILFILSIILFVSYIFFLKNKLINPVKNMNATIEKIGKGNLEEVDIPSDISYEFSNTYKAINIMAKEIKELKIGIYEEKIEKQTIQSQLLRLQIKPHFFLNSLNIILSFARKSQYDMVKKMTIYLADNFRYILYGENLVPLEKEIEHIKNYISIQNIRYEKEYKYLIEVDDNLKLLQVPILCLQTFVENSLKYANPSGDISLSIVIKNVVVRNVEYISICIKDDGKGFTKEMLEILNSSERTIKNTTSGIGIYNLRYRMSETYNGFESLLFANNPDGGANIQILLPKGNSKKREGMVNNE